VTRPALLAAVLLTAATASAEPFTGWTYTATLTPAGGANAVLLDEGARVEVDPATGGEKLVPYIVVTWLSERASGPFEQGATVPLAEFAKFDRAVFDLMPPDLNPSPHTVTATLTFTAPDGTAGRVSADGRLTATGDDGFALTLDGTPQFVTVAERVFGTQFAVRETDDGAVVEFTACATPEPGTLALAGAGLAGLVGARMRRKTGRG
jgi:hypothetical protein